MGNELTVQERREILSPLSTIAQLSKQGAIDAQVLKDLWALQKDYEADQARKAYYDAMNSFKANPPSIIKNARAKMVKEGRTLYEYDFLQLDYACRQIVPALAKVGITHRWPCRMEGDKVSVTCVLTHKLGFSDPEPPTLASLPDQSGGKNPVQAIGSVTRYLERYTLLMACGMASEEKTDGTVPPAEIECLPENTVDEYIDAMNNAPTLNDLKSVFGDCYAKAKKLQDHTAKGRFTKVYEALKKEFSEGAR